ncbi:MAG: hypothetical protein IPG38_16860 [Chitinophagaceae bacterium]|nr:hypothetical protein [Chitinophagaceae bacterium]
MRIPNKPSLNFSDQISLSVWVRPTGFYYDICHASHHFSKGGGNYNPGNYAPRFDVMRCIHWVRAAMVPYVILPLHQNFRNRYCAYTLWR